MMGNAADNSQQELLDELNYRSSVDAIFTSFSETLSLDDASDETTDYECLRSMIDEYREKCGNFGDYLYSKGTLLVKACNTNLPVETLKQVLSELC